jgi:hypothetical protein
VRGNPFGCKMGSSVSISIHTLVACQEGKVLSCEAVFLIIGSILHYGIRSGWLIAWIVTKESPSKTKGLDPKDAASLEASKAAKASNLAVSCTSNYHPLPLSLLITTKNAKKLGLTTTSKFALRVLVCWSIFWDRCANLCMRYPSLGIFLGVLDSRLEGVSFIFKASSCSEISWLN